MFEITINKIQEFRKFLNDELIAYGNAFIKCGDEELKIAFEQRYSTLSYISAQYNQMFDDELQEEL